MDKNEPAIHELDGLQSGIASLFKNVICEKNKYKIENEKTLRSVESLMHELTILREENEQLKKSKTVLRDSCDSCCELKRKILVFDKTYRKLKRSLDALREFLNKVPYKDLSPHFLELLIIQVDELKSDVSQQIGSGNENINDLNDRSSEVCDRDENKYMTQHREEEIITDTFYTINKPLINVPYSEEKKCNEDKLKEREKGRVVETTQGKCVDNHVRIDPSGNDSRAKFELKDAEFRTPKKVERSDLDFISTPVSSDKGIRCGEKSPILLDHRLQNKLSYPSSPSQMKRKSCDMISSSPGKITTKKLFQNSPKQRNFKSPGKGFRSKPSLQFSETDAAHTGVRRLKQTQLNIEYYKSKADDEDEGSKKGHDNNRKLNEDSKLGEDDLILESPKFRDKFVDEIRKIYLKEDVENNRIEARSGPTEAIDPEETFVSSIFLCNNVKQETKQSSGVEDFPPIKTGSPEYNPVRVPYACKGSPVRKKSERMKLPGQTCMECKNYYAAVLEELDPKKLQEILNKCSRHREMHYNVADTPPGYWTPYLTATFDSTVSSVDGEDMDVDA